VFHYRISTYAVILTAYRTGSNRQADDRRAGRDERMSQVSCRHLSFLDPSVDDSINLAEAAA
jgi:hypothetical protein